MSPTTLLRLTTQPLRVNPSIARLVVAQPHGIRRSTPAARTFSTTLSSFYPRKDSQDKDSINRESTEYTRSGTDDSAASDSKAFDPSTTDPGSEMDQGTQEMLADWFILNKKEGSSNLDVSPANMDVSKQRGSTEGGAENAESGDGQKREQKSGGGSPKKGKEI